MSDSKPASSSPASSHSSKLSSPDASLNDARDLTKKMSSLMDSLKEQVIADRRSYIKDKVEANKKKLENITNQVYNMSQCMRGVTANNAATTNDMLTQGKECVMYTMSSAEVSNGYKDNNSCLEEASSAVTSIFSGNNVGGRNTCQLIKLPEVPKLPPYTTWIFLDRQGACCPVVIDTSRR